MILLTGFEPFDGATTNPSIDAARAAATLLNAAGHHAVAIELPCVFATAPAALEAAIDAHAPDLVLCAGLAGGRAAVSLERVAVNLIDARIPDNAGDRPVDVPVEAGGPAARWTTLPLKRALSRLRGEELAAELSLSAGTYVCNQVFYALLGLLPAHGGVRGGFVHLPPAGAGGIGTGQGARALELIALASLDPAPDDNYAAGTVY
ncbi:pyroglutamyl-peptidase I [Paeniglutamicibacter cryotolerans]|uniref:Pyroglutamyl-peptidase I n=1 Tax=Paeniglutamicibacter cryotolerans TaxID=670079 RepID=A0A839QJ42_9MICC|nr:pyroglutamyl-peptidase I [Paeniglutamicibacter cryotolerans]MBB2996209.1 pyroglutamyl-peptidase [Paeniglutamicibacter cryotolerans]